MNELAEVAGQAQVKIELGGQELTLKPFTINDMIEFEREIGDVAEKAGTPQGLRYQVFLMARNGGCELSPEEIGALITTNDLPKLTVAINALMPPASDESGGAASPEPGPGSSGS